MIEHVMAKPTLSQNQWQDMRRPHRSHYIKNMAEALRCVAAHEPELGRVRVLVTVQRFGHSRLDPDNMVGGLKGVIDAVKHAGLAVDDTSKWMARRYEQHRAGPRRSVVTIEPTGSDTHPLTYDEIGF